MPITATRVNERRESFDMPWGEESVHITYAAGAVSQLTREEFEQWEAQGKALEASGDENAARDLGAAILCRFVTVWDVLQDDGSMLPLDIEHVAPLDIEFNWSIIFGVLEDYRAKKANGMLSRALSGATSSAVPTATA